MCNVIFVPVLFPLVMSATGYRLQGLICSQISGLIEEASTQILGLLFNVTILCKDMEKPLAACGP